MSFYLRHRSSFLQWMGTPLMAHWWA